jgi:hypothetical protein
MIDYESLKLMHFHGDDAVELVETSEPHHDPASHDIEHGIGWFNRVFQCPTCEEEIVVAGRGSEPASSTS